MDVRVKRLIATEVYDNDLDLAQTNYFAVDTEEALLNINAGDIIQVTVQEVTVSTSRRVTYALLKLDEGPLEFTLAGVVG